MVFPVLCVKGFTICTIGCLARVLSVILVEYEQIVPRYEFHETRMISEKTVGRLTLYRRLLSECAAEGKQNIYSHEIAAHTGNTSAQVRRDLMEVGYDGNSRRGYDVRGLMESLEEFLDRPGGEPVALVGIGNLGRALLAFFSGRRPGLSIVAGFDKDPFRNGRVIHGCPCHPMEEMEEAIEKHGIGVAVLTVPAAEAQNVAERLIRAGVRGILNFAPVPLAVPGHVHVDNIDLTMALEKVAFNARQKAQLRR